MYWTQLAVVLFMCHCGNTFVLGDQQLPATTTYLDDDMNELSEQDRQLIHHFDRRLQLLTDRICSCYSSHTQTDAQTSGADGEISYATCTVITAQRVS
jgi:hypothetical protein